jgi:hypothetical protein
VIALPEHEGDAVGLGERAGGLPHDDTHGRFISRGREGGYGIKEGIAYQLHSNGSCFQDGVQNANVATREQCGKPLATR